MDVEIISWSVSTEVLWPGWGSNSRLLNLQSDTLPAELRSLAKINLIYALFKLQFKKVYAKQVITCIENSVCDAEQFLP